MAKKITVKTVNVKSLKVGALVNLNTNGELFILEKKKRDPKSNTWTLKFSKNLWRSKRVVSGTTEFQVVKGKKKKV